jgi:hypothetical protein
MQLRPGDDAGRAVAGAIDTLHGNRTAAARVVLDG